MQRRVLVTGASGFVGSLLAGRLRSEGHAVRALGREPARVRAALARAQPRRRASGAHADAGDAEVEVEVVRADLLSADGLARALDEIEVAYYLIHSMERPAAGEAAFAERDRVAAENFAAAAAAAGVHRIVYLGGLTPRPRASVAPAGGAVPAAPAGPVAPAGGAAPTAPAGPAAPAGGDAPVRVSRHLASREQVERILLEATADSLALRASIVIGARSRSFRLLVRLLERMPVLALPSWRSLRTQPIDERDVIAMLAACATATRLSRRSLDIGGPDVLTYGEMLQSIAELMLVNRPAIELGVSLTGVTARVAAAIAGEDPELVVALMEGLHEDLLPANDRAAELLGVRLHSFDAAVEHALAEWDAFEPLAAR